MTEAMDDVVEAVKRLRTYQAIGKGAAIDLNGPFLADLEAVCAAALAKLAPEPPLAELQRLGQEFDASEPVDEHIEWQLRDKAAAYSDTMGLTREGAIRRLGVLVDLAFAAADTLAASEARQAEQAATIAQALTLIDELNKRKLSRFFYGINQNLHAKLATIRGILARTALEDQHG